MKNDIVKINVDLNIPNDLIERIESDWKKHTDLPVLIWLQVATHKFKPIGWYGEFIEHNQLTSLYERDYVNGFYFESHGIKFYGSTAEKDFVGVEKKLNNKIVEYNQGKCLIKLANE